MNERNTVMKMVLLGPPGAGKGTQAAAIMKKLDIPSISTGDILRDAVARKTPVGLKAKAYMDAGELVPDEVIIGIVIDRITKQDCANGYILDGVPRTLVQAAALDEQGISLDVVLSIELEDETIVERLSGRRACPDCNSIFHIISNPPAKQDVCDNCGASLIIRKDDAEETIRNRLIAYHNETEPLIEYYTKQGKVKTVSSDQSVADTTVAVFKTLGI